MSYTDSIESYNWINNQTYPKSPKPEEQYAPPSPKSPLVKIARPQNAWILFRTYRCRERKDYEPEKLTQGELSKLLAIEWKNCSPEIRKKFEDEAEVKKAEHTRLYPNFKFRQGPVVRKNGKSKSKPARVVIKDATYPSWSSEDGRTASPMKNFAGNAQEPARYTFGSQFSKSNQDCNRKTQEPSTSTYADSNYLPPTASTSRTAPIPIPILNNSQINPVLNNHAFAASYPTTTNYLSNHHHYYNPRRASVSLDQNRFQIPTHHQFLNSALMGINHDQSSYQGIFQDSTAIGNGSTQFTIPENLDSSQIYAFDRFYQANQ